MEREIRTRNEYDYSDADMYNLSESEAQSMLERKREDAVTSAMSRIMRNVYLWMTLGLAITAFTALFVSSSSSILAVLFGSPLVLIGMCVAELVLVIVFASRIEQMSFATAGVIFAVYSILTGATLSPIMLVYTSSLIEQAFFVTAGMFLAMSLVGFFSKKDLSGWGRALLMAILGLIIATVVNLFFHNSGLTMILNYVGVLVFVLLTAYDTQKIKQLAMGQYDEEMEGKVALWGSLMLYLDFINIFLYILRIMSRD